MSTHHLELTSERVRLSQTGLSIPEVQQLVTASESSLTLLLERSMPMDPDTEDEEEQPHATSAARQSIGRPVDREEEDLALQAGLLALEQATQSLRSSIAEPPSRAPAATPGRSPG